jgi:hypothetical protein
VVRRYLMQALPLAPYAVEPVLLSLSGVHIVPLGEAWWMALILPTVCGGIGALLDGHGHGLEEMPSVREWLENARAAVEGAQVPDRARWWRAAVEANVLASMANLSTYPVVARALEADRLDLHGWVYDLHGADLDVYDGRQGRFVPQDQVLTSTIA